jgi:Ca2+-binding RTX toxin-like protein
MRRVILLLAAMTATLVVASGLAWAVNKIGTNGPDTLRGTDGDDNLLGKGGNDVHFGLGGSDNLLGGEGKDWVAGGDERIPFGGDKNLVGGPGNDGVQGGLGSDNALGGSGNDFVHGDNGSDRVMGEEGRDFVDGGRGSDRMVGGEGGDNSWSLIHSHSLKHAHGGGASRAVARDRAARGERRLRQRDYTLACASTPTSVSYLLAAVGTVATHDNHRSTTIPASPPCTPRLSAPTAGRHHFAGSGYSGVASLPCFFAFSQAA